MWYVIWTTTGKEEQCRYQIYRYCDPATFTRCVVPMIQRKKHEKGVWVTKTERFAPSYVFVESNTIMHFAMEISHIVGFRKLLQNDNLFLPLHPREEEIIAGLLGGGEIIGESIGYKEGQKVIVTDGPLLGMEGMIKYIDRHKRLAVLEMELFDRVIEMRLGLEVVKADEAKDANTTE